MTNKQITTTQGCKYCDCTARTEVGGILHCFNCMTEWEGVDVQATISFCHYHQETLLNGEPCFTCEDEAETQRLLMEDME